MALVILGLGVYLFLAVRGEPAAPEVAQAPQVPHPVAVAAPPIAHKRPKPTPTPTPPPTDNSESVPVVTGVPQVIIGPPIDRDAPLDGKLDILMDEANKAYDRSEFEVAKTLAGRVLGRDPTNVRMLRIMVSASCQDGDTASAQTHFRTLPPSDQEQMRTRCARYGVTFPNTP